MTPWTVAHQAPLPMGILQARILEWVAMPSPGDLPNPGIETRYPSLQVESLPSEPPGKSKNTGVDSPSLLQGIFPTQGLNWGLYHCRQILYRLSHQRSLHSTCYGIIADSSVQFSSIAQLCLTLCNPWTTACQASLSIINSQNLLKLMSSESVMPSNHLILSSPSPPAFNLSQQQGLFKWVSSSHQVAKLLEFQLQHQSFQWIFRTDFL